MSWSTALLRQVANLAIARAVNVHGTTRLAEAGGVKLVPGVHTLSSQSARADAAAAYGQNQVRGRTKLLSMRGCK